MSGRRRFERSIKRLDIVKQDEIQLVPAVLGLTIGGSEKVEVPTRPGFVYCRVRSNLSEVVQAYNDQVAAVYDLPVLIARDKVNKTQYYVAGRDIGRYQDWGSSTYVPDHHRKHEFNPNGAGNDIVWVYGKQFMPNLVYPSGTFGTDFALYYPQPFYSTASGSWFYSDIQPIPNILSYKPTGTNARVVMTYLDGSDTVKVMAGNYLALSATGIASIVGALPALPTATSQPLMAFRLVSGTSTLVWEEMYDIRQFIGGGGGGIDVYADSVPFVDNVNTINFTGDLSVTDNGGGQVTVDYTTPSFPEYLDDLLDVDTSTVNAGQLLEFDGGDWVPSTTILIDTQATKIGDIAGGNYSTIEADGTLIFTGDAIVFDDMLQSLIGQDLESPSAHIEQNHAEGSLNFESNCDLTDYVTMNIQMSHSWYIGSDIHPHIHWWQTSADVPNWLIQYRWQVQGGLKTTAWTYQAWTSHQFTWATGTLNQITEFSTINPPGGASLSDIVQFRLLRDTGNASGEFGDVDPINATVQGINFDIHYEKNKIGSHEEYVD